MSPIDAWYVLGDLLSESEFRALDRKEDPIRIWANRCGKTESWARAYFEDYDRRKILGHLNSVESDQFPYEGSRSGQMFSFWTQAIASLPADVIEQMGASLYLKLCDAYHLPKEFQVYDPSVPVEYSPEEMKEKVSRISKGDLQVFEFGYQYHSIYLVFGSGYLLICNRGYNLPEFFDGTKTIRAYKIDCASVIENDLYSLLSIAQCFKYSTEPDVLSHLYQEIPQRIAVARNDICDQLETLTTGFQKVGNCTSTSCKEAILGSLALLFIKKTGSGDLITQEDLINAKSLKNKISAHARAIGLESYFQAHPNGDSDDVFDSPLVGICLKKTKSHLEKTNLDIYEYPRIAQEVESSLMKFLSIASSRFLAMSRKYLINGITFPRYFIFYIK